MTGKPKTPLDTAQRAQIVTFAASGQSETKIANQIGRSRKAVHNALAEPEIQQQVTDEKAVLADMFRSKARACVEAIDDDKIAKSSGLQLMTMAGISMDKALLLAGDPTANVRIEVLMEVAGAIRAQDAAASRQQFQKAHALLDLPAPQ